MFKPSTYSWCCWCHVPRVRDHPSAIVHHLTHPPRNEQDQAMLDSDLVEEFGQGTEQNPFRVYRNSNALKRLRFVCMSDTHNEIAKITIPDGDVLIHCGDAVKHQTSARDLRVFNEFVGGLPHRYKLFVSGNHCVCLDPKRPKRSQKLLSNLTYLQDDLIDIEGVRIYGSPWRPKRGCFYRAEAFGYDAERIGKDKWSKIPEEIDFLLTHGPPYSIRDYIPRREIRWVVPLYWTKLSLVSDPEFISSDTCTPVEVLVCIGVKTMRISKVPSVSYPRTTFFSPISLSIREGDWLNPPSSIIFIECQ